MKKSLWAESAVSSETPDKQSTGEGKVEDENNDKPEGEINSEAELKPYPRNITVTGDSKEDKVED